MARNKSEKANHLTDYLEATKALLASATACPGRGCRDNGITVTCNRHDREHKHWLKSRNVAQKIEGTDGNGRYKLVGFRTSFSRLIRDLEKYIDGQKSK